ncbi:ABC transporter permease subunit [Clostridium estertheticum]|nr:ABC transporter permease subunit [Clostridium estertheticum]
MNKVVNKALFYKEWINVRWVTLLTIIVLSFFKVYGVISALNQEKMYETRQGWVLPNRWFNNGLYRGGDHYSIYFFIMVIVVIILAITLFISEKTSENQGFIASMPFTRKEIIINKWLVGVISLLISFAVTYIFLSLFYFKNISSINTILNPYSDIVKWFFMDTFQYICIFTFMMLMQSVMGNSIVSSMVGGIILVVPYFITMMIQSLTERVYGFTQYRYLIFNKICHWLNIYGYNYANNNYLSSTAINGMCNISYTNYKSKLLVLFLLTCLFLFLANLAYKKRNIEYNLRLIAFKNLEPVFTGGVAICSGLLVGGIFGNDRLREFGIYFIIFTIIGYFISKLLLLKVLSSRK